MAPPDKDGGRPLRVLAIGDPHEKVRTTARGRSRWIALARFVCRQKPDVIIWNGDHWDLPCLGHRSKSRGGPGPGARQKAGTFEQEIQAGRDAILLFLGEIKRYNKRASRSGQAALVYRPRFVFCLGNHEMRVDEPGNEMVEFVDHFTVDKWITSWLREQGFEVVPFLEAVCVGGVFFTHFVESGAMGKAVPIAHAPRLIGRSTVWGHTHRLGYAERQIPDVLGGGWDKWLSLPTFKDPAHLLPGESSGVALLDDVWGGNFTLSIISTERLLQDYGPIPA